MREPLTTDGENQVAHFTDGENEGRKMKYLGHHVYSQCLDHLATMEINLPKEMAFRALPRSLGVLGDLLVSLKSRKGRTIGRPHIQQVNCSWNQLPKPVPFPTPTPSIHLGQRDS